MMKMIAGFQRTGAGDITVSIDRQRPFSGLSA